MADFAAHLNQRQSLNRPSFFELAAQEGMEMTLRRAFEFFLNQISMSYPTNYGWLSHRCDELYTAFNFILQYHSISKYEASISEKFYGMKRVPSARQESRLLFHRRISDTKKMLSMFFLVAVPYVKVKLDRLYGHLQEEHECETNSSEHTLGHLLKESFFKTYPYVHFIWESLILLYQLLYLFKYSKFYSPFLMLAGVQLARQTKEDLSLETVQSSNGGVMRLLEFVIGLLTKSVPVGVFFLKFLNWWHSDEHTRVTAAITRLPAPPPPDPLQPAPGVSLPPHPVQCPLCFKSRRTASVLTTSGYVFCYACAYDYIEHNGKCPVTHLPTTTAQLVRLYPNS
ncbi:peroxisome assembly protein 12-like isoform X2 [Corticium candelabrum]|uniref:peroxisome assembly protein 12-like isoform X2 n=1 Tax=Corticium candelabrum TaxID=121492 RepID=UPI002E270F59|nr:peroxisome assembly protein 12-like isoform X2 [Corticium candelabrum]